MEYSERSPLLFDTESLCPEESFDPNNIINDWSKENYMTIRNWKETLVKNSFIYQHLIDKYKSRLNRILILALILSTIATLLASVSTTIQGFGNKKGEVAVFFIGIFTIIINGIITISNGYIKIYKFDDILTSYTAYIEKVDNLCYLIIDQLGQPVHLRVNATVFISKHSKAYLNIMQNTPAISTDDLNEATSQYDKYLSNRTLNYKFSQKF